MTSTLTHLLHAPLPDGLVLLDRPARGWELAAVEIVAVDDDLDRAVMAQQQAAARGRLGPGTVAVLLLSWTSRRVPPHQMARQMARGRPPQVTEKVRVWQGHVVAAGRPGPVVCRDADLGRVVTAVLARRR